MFISPFLFSKKGYKMTRIYLVANDQGLTATQQPKIASGNKKSVGIHVDFDSHWDGYAKSAVFFTEKEKIPYEMVLTLGECEIPVEVLVNSGAIFIGMDFTKEQP